MAKKQDDNLIGGKVPPQAVELEQAVLGALMLEKDAINRVDLKSEFFYKQAHQDIFTAIQQLNNEKFAIDLLTVIQKIRSNGKIDLIGGPQYIAELTSKVSSAANIEFHCQIIIQKFIQRELIRTSGNLSKLSYDETSDIFDLIEIAHKDINQISMLTAKGSIGHEIKDLNRDWLKEKEIIASSNQILAGISSELNDLDGILGGFQKSNLYILAARPAMGKTSLALKIAKAAANLGNPTAFFSLEMSITQMLDRLNFSIAGIDISKASNTKLLNPYEWSMLNNAVNESNKLPLIVDDTGGLTIFDLKIKARKLKNDKGIKMIVVDYLQLMKGSANSSKNNREQEISEISRGLKEIAKDLNIPVIALSQLSRSVESRSDKKPQLSDLRESGAIEQDADVVLFLYRPQYYGITQNSDGSPTAGLANIVIAKQRNGATGEIVCKFINETTEFENLYESNVVKINNQEIDLEGIIDFTPF